MNFQNIEYFLKVVEYKNFSKAAESLYVSQQSLSENIHRLEKEVGTPLLIRGKTITLTPAGESFVRGGRRILKEYDKMLREIEEHLQPSSYSILIGVSKYDIPPFLLSVISLFSTRYPAYDLTVTSNLTNKIADLNISYTDTDKGNRHIPLIKNDPFAVVFSRTLALQIYGEEWPAAEQLLNTTHSLVSVSRLPFLILTDNNQPEFFTRQVFEQEEFSPEETIKSGNLNLLISLCENGNGAYVGPYDYCVRKFGAFLDPSTGHLCCVKLAVPVSINLNVVFPINKTLNVAEKHFLELLMGAL